MRHLDTFRRMAADPYQFQSVATSLPGLRGISGADGFRRPSSPVLHQIRYAAPFRRHGPSSTEALAGQIDRLLIPSSKTIAQRIATLTRDMISLSVAIMTLLTRSEDISRVRVLSQDAELAELAITCTALMESLALKLKSCERDADWYMFLTLHLPENEVMRDVLRRRNLESPEILPPTF
jgi:hypothetical protein